MAVRRNLSRETTSYFSARELIWLGNFPNHWSCVSTGDASSTTPRKPIYVYVHPRKSTPPLLQIYFLLPKSKNVFHGRGGGRSV
jgi:hypothetical protein